MVPSTAHAAVGTLPAGGLSEAGILLHQPLVNRRMAHVATLAPDTPPPMTTALARSGKAWGMPDFQPARLGYGYFIPRAA